MLEIVMSETQKLKALRAKLVARRRTLVESFQKTSSQQITGTSIVEIQSAIEAVDRALAEETAEEEAAAARRPVSA
jgi:hypothetical protein